MKLLQLNLKNFKGCRSFEFVPAGKNCSVYGDNGTFKTTLFDAFIWLLFDKDSQNKKDFDIKTLDDNGEPIHGLDHEVEGVFLIGDNEATLRKVYAEQWTKKRGSASSVFSGHTTDHFLNGVPVQKKEYVARIAEIADEEIFKMLTSPTYFNTQLHWQDRRRILLEVCGDVSDAEVIASNEALAGLPGILKGRKLDDHRKVIAARRAEINKELDKIPVRIDEVEKGLPDVTGINPKELTSKAAEIKSVINKKELQITRIQTGGEIAEKTKKLREIEAEIQGLKTAHANKVQAEIDAKRKSLNEMPFDALSGLSICKRAIKDNEQQILDLEKMKGELRDKWHAINSREPLFNQDDTCPTCGQAIPEEQLEEAREKALAVFNRAKSEDLEEVVRKGKDAKAETEGLQEKNRQLQEQADILYRQHVQDEKKAAAIRDEIEQLQDMAKTEGFPCPVELLRETNKLESAIEDLKSGNLQETENIRSEIIALQEALSEAEKQIAEVNRRNQGQERVEELKAQERHLAAEFERLEAEIHMAEEFTRAKVAMLDEKINSRFKHARFKLFEVQVNGGLSEVCETIYNGVPYSSGLNNGHRLIVGLDIINTLSEHYGFDAPVFLDNAEAVTKLIPTRAQLVRLVVSEEDKNLRVEAE